MRCSTWNIHRRVFRLDNSIELWYTARVDTESTESSGHVAKPNDNFLRGWAKQLRAALDEGVELGYEVAELIDEALDLITDPSSDDELGMSDAGGDGSDDGDHQEPDGGLEEGILRDEPDLGGRVRGGSTYAKGVDASMGGHASSVAGTSSGDARRALDVTCVRVPGKHRSERSRR